MDQRSLGIASPLAIDLFCGLGGWTSGLLAEGYDVIGFDIEQHVYGEHRYPAQLVVQDVLTLPGSQFRNAALIVASPPCQAYSYMAMPWTKAKAKAAAIRADATGDALRKLNALFEACFRIQREACEAAGRHIPMIVENVKGAQPWVGRARWNYGSFYLWGDIPALMPITKVVKVPGVDWHNFGKPGYEAPSFRDNARARESFKSSGMNWSDPTKRGQDFTRVAGNQAMVEAGTKGIPHSPAGHWTDPGDSGTKHHGSGAAWFDTGPAALPSSSPRRKFASVMIARIPAPLARHVAKVYFPC